MKNQIKNIVVAVSICTAMAVCAFTPGLVSTTPKTGTSITTMGYGVGT